MNDETESADKQKRHRKVKKIKKTSHTVLSDNRELQQEESNDSEQEDGPQMPSETSQKSSHPRRSSKHKTNMKSNTSKRGSIKHPHTIITAVLEELNDDLVDELPREGGDSMADVSQTPISLPPDKVYVERKKGFATAPRAKMFNSLSSVENGLGDGDYSKALTTPLELAIFIQKCCRPLYTLCHGLLGGMALLHLILVYGAGDYYLEEKNFVHMYISYARIYQSIFHILSILCLISIMDRCDAKHMDVNQFVDLFRFHFSTILVLTVYLTTLVLTFVTTKWDDWLALSPQNDSGEFTVDKHKLTVWKSLNLCRSIGAISGWILVALFPAEDLLYLHLCSMIKYQTLSSRATPARY